MSAGTIFLVLLVVLGLVLLFLTAVGVSTSRVGLLAAGLFCWMLAWAILDVFPRLTS